MNRRLRSRDTSFSLICLIFAMGCSKPAPTAEDHAGFRVANVASATVTEVAVGDEAQTYAKVTEAQWSFWIRTETTLAAGDYVLLGRGPLHKRHHDNTLNRTFPEVIALDEVKVVTREESEQFIALPAYEGDHGVAVADLFGRRAELADKPVAVRGRIVKANKNIFDTNWYHLQDGTGSGDTSDLTVSSNAEANVGDIVVARAKLTKDHSLGFGYDYDAILLDAELKIEERSGIVQEAGEAVIPRELIETTAAAGKADGEAEAVKSAAEAAKQESDPATRAAIQDWAQLRAKAEAARTVADSDLEDLDVLGLELGTSDDAAITTWLADQQIQCSGAKSERRSGFSWDCREGLDGKAPGGRTVENGKLTRLMLGHADDQPLGFVTLTHQFSIPKDAHRAYVERITTLTERLGEPTTAKSVDPESLNDAKIGRFKTEWRYPNADVSVVLFVIDRRLRVTERWNLATDEKRFEVRPGAKPIHGAIRRAPNPHIQD